MGITSPGHVTRWWVRKGHDAISPHWANMGYYPYPFTGPTPCGPDSETQDDRFPLSQPGGDADADYGVGTDAGTGREPGPSAKGETSAGLWGESGAAFWGEPGAAFW
jgi:hypothetical protein